MRAALICLLVACGSKPAPKPRGLEPAALAKMLDDDMTTLGVIAHRQRGNCISLATELRPHVDRMKLHAADVERMLADPVKARELKSALTRYPGNPTRTDQIAQDLGATYLGCKDDQTQRYALERVIADIPTY